MECFAFILGLDICIYVVLYIDNNIIMVDVHYATCSDTSLFAISFFSVFSLFSSAEYTITFYLHERFNGVWY